MAKTQEAQPNRAEILEVYRALDHRKYTSVEELMPMARLYNVKAELWKFWRRNERDPAVFDRIRKKAVLQLVERGGGTIDELCTELENFISLPSNNPGYRYSDWKRATRRISRQAR